MRKLALCVMMVLSNPAWGEFKPLTREEPIVRMVLQEAANEPFAGMVAVAGVTVLWYHTINVSPSWRKRLALKCQLGVHLFYGDDK